MWRGSQKPAGRHAPCQTCSNPCLKSEALKKFCCSSGDSELKSLSKTFPVSARRLSQITLCPYDKHPKQECLNRSCNECGTKLLENCYSAVTERAKLDDAMTWYKWGPMTLVTNGIPKRIIACQAKTASVTHFMTSYKENLKLLPQHLFRASWQHDAMAAIVKSVPKNEAVLVIDYAES